MRFFAGELKLAKSLPVSMRDKRIGASGVGVFEKSRLRSEQRRVAGLEVDRERASASPSGG